MATGDKKNDLVWRRGHHAPPPATNPSEALTKRAAAPEPWGRTVQSLATSSMEKPGTSIPSANTPSLVPKIRDAAPPFAPVPVGVTAGVRVPL
jgi:hypothetical protein